MQVLVAEHSGFCAGVERAFRIAGETAREGKPVFMLGNLVHNKQVVERLNDQNVRTVSSLNEIPAGTHGILLISAHGVAPEVYAAAKKLSLHVIDTTCPWVKKAQKIAKQLAEEGRLVIIVGDRGHPEVQALLGWSGGQGTVVERAEDLDKLSLRPGQKIGVIAQTTQSKEHFAGMVSLIKKSGGNVAEFDTICDATLKRQSAAVALARSVDLMLVVGDRLSANTKRLAELCSATGTETHQIQTVAELDAGWLAGKAKVGITAGASTPEWTIQDVLDKLRS